MIISYARFPFTRPKDTVSYNMMSIALVRHGPGTDKFELFNEMAKDGLPPGPVRFLGVLSICIHAGLAHRGKPYLEAMGTT